MLPRGTWQGPRGRSGRGSPGRALARAGRPAVQVCVAWPPRLDPWPRRDRNGPGGPGPRVMARGEPRECQCMHWTRMWARGRRGARAAGGGTGRGRCAAARMPSGVAEGGGEARGRLFSPPPSRPAGRPQVHARLALRPGGGGNRAIASPPWWVRRARAAVFSRLRMKRLGVGAGSDSERRCLALNPAQA